MMSSEKQNRIQWIDFAKGITILLVIIGHALDASHSVSEKYIVHVIFSFHMPLFYILSAYTFRYSKDRKQFAARTKRAFCHLILPAYITFILTHVLKYIYIYIYI